MNNNTIINSNVQILTTTKIENLGTCLVVFGYASKGDKTSSTLKFTNSEFKSLSSKLTPSIDEKLFQGKPKEVLFFREIGFLSFRHVLLVGLGAGSAEEFRAAGASAYKALSAAKVDEAGIVCDGISGKAHEWAAFAQGMHLASYQFNELKSSKTDPKNADKKALKINLIGKNVSDKTVLKALDEARLVSEVVNYSRRLGDLPGNLMTPTILADSAAAAAKQCGVKATIWDKKRCEKERMGGLLGVANGSAQEPRFIILEYTGAAKTQKPLVLVGKGLTFDTGGISIKPSASMEEMKYDMCGGANVIGAILAIARLKLKINVVALIASTENMPGSRATKPGDVHTARNGKTFEVNNTDAEGRLILADALSYGSELDPQVMVDAATLTGAMVVALGNIHTGFFTRNEALSSKVNKAAGVSDECVWRMPLVDHHVEDMKGTFADLSNTSSAKGAGSATASAFLEQFVGSDIPWAHFDIAGTGWAVGNRLNYCTSKGASGVMIRTFVELAKQYVK